MKPHVLEQSCALVVSLLMCASALVATISSDAVAEEGVRNASEWNIIDHTCADITAIPESAIEAAKAELHIGYGHTSHGSQLTTGMDALVGFMEGLGSPDGLYDYNDGGAGGALDLRDGCFDGASDLGNPDFTAWAAATQAYLDAHADLNVVIWSWCGQVSSATEANIDTYLALMDGLEDDNPGVRFVYMTGHLDGSGLTGNLHIRNEQIREYCRTNDKILYDFNDIEMYDPDGTYFGDKTPNDNCDYDTDTDGSLDGNWAIEWQDAHDEGVDWFDCSAAHSQPLNGNQKAYAAWWLWAALAGWDQVSAGPVDPADDTTPPVARTMAEQSVAPGEEAHFSAAASSDNSGIANYTWTFSYNGSEVHIYGEAPGFEFWAEGDYTVTLAVEDLAGNTDEATTIVHVTEEAASDDGTEDDLADYWWILVIFAVAVVLAIVVVAMKRK